MKCSKCGKTIKGDSIAFKTDNGVDVTFCMKCAEAYRDASTDDKKQIQLEIESSVK